MKYLFVLPIIAGSLVSTPVASADGLPSHSLYSPPKRTVQKSVQPMTYTQISPIATAQAPQVHTQIIYVPYERKSEPQKEVRIIERPIIIEREVEKIVERPVVKEIERIIERPVIIERERPTVRRPVSVNSTSKRRSTHRYQQRRSYTQPIYNTQVVPHYVSQPVYYPTPVYRPPVHQPVYQPTYHQPAYHQPSYQYNTVGSATYNYSTGGYGGGYTYKPGYKPYRSY